MDLTLQVRLCQGTNRFQSTRGHPATSLPATLRSSPQSAAAGQQGETDKPLSADQSSSPPSLASKNDSAVRLAFAKVGVSEQSIESIMSRYLPYSNWGVEMRLQPAIDRWLQKLGKANFHTAIQQAPRLLAQTSDEWDSVHAVLLAAGVQDTRKVFGLSATVVQQKVNHLEGAGFKGNLLATLLQRHSSVLLYSQDHIQETLSMIAGLLQLPMASDELVDTVLKCNSRLFDTRAATMRSCLQMISSEFTLTRRQTRRALLRGCYNIPQDVVHARALHLKALHELTNEELRYVIALRPEIFQVRQETIRASYDAFRALGFSPLELKHMCCKIPDLVYAAWDSSIRRAKMSFITSDMQLTLPEIVARPMVLKASLPHRIRPRWRFLESIGALPACIADMTNVVYMTDSGFAAMYNKVDCDPPLMYNAEFKKLCHT